jgi:hypothetical protein
MTSDANGLPDVFTAYATEGLSTVAESYPVVAKKLAIAAAKWADDLSTEDCQAVGLLCRDAFISFSNAIYSPDFLPSGETPPAADAATKKIRLTLSHFGQMTNSESLRKVASDAMDHSFKVHHDLDATPENARRCLIFTTVALTELTLLMREAIKNSEFFKKYAFYKCSTCGSTQLEEDVDVEYDRDGAVSGTVFVYCKNCGANDPGPSKIAFLRDALNLAA